MIPAFYIGVYKDQGLAAKRIVALRTLYPQSPIISISDGINDSDYADVCTDNNVLYSVGERLKIPEFAGQWNERWMSAYLAETDSPLVIKLDPDTGVFKTLTEFSPADVFGQHSILPNGDLQILDGCIGYRRSAVERILAAGMLRQHRFGSPKYSYPRFSGIHLKLGEQPDPQPVSVSSWIASYIVKHLKLTISSWPEVRVNFGIAPQIDPAGFAFVHPFRD